MDFESAIENYLHYSDNNFSKRTIEVRKYELGRFSAFCIKNGVNNIEKLHKGLVLDFLSGLNIANSTKITLIVILAAFMDYLVTEGHILENYAALVKKPRRNKPVQDFLTENEIKKFYNAIEADAGPKFKDRNLLMVEMFLWTCLRAEELVNIKEEDMRLDELAVAVTRKGGEKAVLPITPHAAELYKNWLVVRKNFKGNTLAYVFLSSRGNRIARRQARQIVAKGLRHAGLSKMKRGTHLLRHSGASFYLEAGENPKNVQYLLGHSNLATTAIYIHLQRASVQNMVKNAPNINDNE